MYSLLGNWSVRNTVDAYTGNTANTANINTQKQSKRSKQSKHCKCTATTANKQVHHQTRKQCNSAQNANLHHLLHKTWLTDIVSKFKGREVGGAAGGLDNWHFEGYS